MNSFQNQRMAEVFKALGHPLRVRIIELLLDGERCVCEIFPEVSAEQSNTSQHLAVMKNAGILNSYREGSKVIYGISNSEYKELFRVLKGITLKNEEEKNV